MSPFKAAAAGFSTAMVIALAVAAALFFVIRANSRADAAEAKAAAAVQAQVQADERRELAEKNVGFVREVAVKETAARVAAESKVAGFAAELARVKAAAGKNSAVVAAGSGSSTPVAGLSLFSAGDQGTFQLQIAGVKAEHGTLALATWARAMNATTGKPLFEAAVPITVDYTPPAPEVLPPRREFSLFGSCMLVDKKVGCTAGPSGTVKVWKLWGDHYMRFDAGVGIWPAQSVELRIGGR